jgi:hypothetical protein
MVKMEQYKENIIQIAAGLLLNVIIIISQLILHQYPFAIFTMSAWYYSLALVSFFKNNEIINSILLSSLGIMIYVVIIARSLFDFHTLIIISCCLALITTKRTYNFKIVLTFAAVDIIWANSWVYRGFGLNMTIATLLCVVFIAILNFVKSFQEKQKKTHQLFL